MNRKLYYKILIIFFYINYCSAENNSLVGTPISNPNKSVYQGARNGQEGRWRDSSYYEMRPHEWTTSRDVKFKGNSNTSQATVTSPPLDSMSYPNEKVSPFTYPVYYPLYRYKARGISKKGMMPQGSHYKVAR